MLNFILRVVRTPPTFPESALRSPFSLSQVTKKDLPLNESEAAEALLSLISLRHENIENARHFEHCDMVIDTEIQPQSVSIDPETPLSPHFIPGSILPSFTDPRGPLPIEIERETLIHIRDGSHTVEVNKRGY